ncbi:MAG: monooxygenase, partial [Pseudomonadota bacterium]
MRTLHGVHIHGFPNLFMVQPYQAANLISNVPHNIVDHANTISTVVKHAEDSGARTVEPEKAAQDAWVELILSGQGMLIGSTECTPGYYNNEGAGINDRNRHGLGHPAGAKVFFAHIKAWRESGDFKGLTFAV